MIYEHKLSTILNDCQIHVLFIANLYYVLQTNSSNILFIRPHPLRKSLLPWVQKSTLVAVLMQNFIGFTLAQIFLLVLER